MSVDFIRRARTFLVWFFLLVSGAFPTATAATEGSAPGRANLPGLKPDGSVLLHNGWSLRPAGRQIELGDFPVNAALHPGGRFAAVLHAGYSRHEIAVVDLNAGRVVSQTPVDEAFYGIEFSKDGRRIFCSGAGDEVVHQFDFVDGGLTNEVSLRLHGVSDAGLASGLAVNEAGTGIFAADVLGQRVSRIRLGPSPATRDIPLPGAYPYACRLDEQRDRLYVSLWAQSAVAVIDLRSNTVSARWPTQEHPCEMALTASGKYLYVANANRNTVTVFDTDSGNALETLWAALYPQAPPGSTPNSLALAPDERTLFVANANINAVAVFDVSAPGHGRSLGFIPVGWYPTSVRVTPDGAHLLVCNGKGITTMANPHGPQPSFGPRSGYDDPTVQYIARLYHGAMSIIDLPSGEAWNRQLAAYTARTFQCSPLQADAGVSTPRPARNPVPARPGDAGPIQYVVYIIKENRTYDQVLGDMAEGNGDTNLCLFPERVTPNHHRLARQFVLLDNFYADAQVSADGHEWSMGAYASDFVEKMWRLNYRHSSGGKYPYPGEGAFPIAAPAGGYLWDRARDAGVTYRSYGEFVDNGAKPGAPAVAKVPALQDHIDESFRGFDLSYPDRKRATRFISEWKRFEQEGGMPRLQVLRLPNDHTHGSTIGFQKPESYVADNDQALGQVIETISRSKLWPQTAVFVVEDDAQNGPDHVDAHRTVALVVSPYTKHGVVDSTLYSTTSMVRTIELILGLQPMSQFDAASTPMFQSFQPEPDLRPYDAVPPNVKLDALNGPDAWGGRIVMDFSKEDAADDLLLNEAVWRSVRGPGSPMPAPIHAAFVFTPKAQADDD
jgi:DNA-binding beta-propeller fold protein YncE